MKKGLLIAISIIVFLLLCSLGVELWLRHAVRTAIEKEVASLAGPDARVELGRISVNLPTRSVTIRDIVVSVAGDDSLAHDKTLVSLEGRIDKISVSGLGYKKRDGRAHISASTLNIVSPEATLVTRKATPAEENPKVSSDGCANKNRNSFAVKNVSVTGAALDYTRQLSGEESTRWELGGVNVRAAGFTLDSLSAPLTAGFGKVLFSDDVTLTADSISYGFGAGAQMLRFDTLALDTKRQTLMLKRFALVPQFPKHEFAERSPGHKDWTEVELQKIICTGLDYGKLTADKIVAMDSLTLGSVHVASYKNRKIYQEPTVKPLIWQTIQRLPVGLDIETFVFDNFDARYDELSAEGDTPGVVTLTRGSGTAHNVTNIAEGHDRFMKLDMVATFMGTGRLEARFDFPVAPSDDRWEMKGTLGHADMTSFNAALEPLMNARITSGAIQSMDYDLTGTSALSHMALTMRYDDLKVEFLKKDDHSRDRHFLTFLANDILIRSDNPGRNGKGKLRTAEATCERDPERSMYNYIWHSFSPALVKTVM